MFFLEGVVVRSGCCASLREVSELMDVDSVFAVGAKTFDRAGDLSGGVDVILAEGGHTSDSRVVVGVEDTDGVSLGVGSLILVEGEERCKGSCEGKGDCFSEHY